MEERRLSRRTIIIVCLVAGQVLDLVTTYIGFRYGLYEGNPLPAWVQSVAGDLSLAMLKVVAIALILGIALMLQRQYPRLWYGVAGAAVVTLVVVASNAVSIALAMG